jgi:hypothetical protein
MVLEDIPSFPGNPQSRKPVTTNLRGDGECSPGIHADSSEERAPEGVVSRSTGWSYKKEGSNALIEGNIKNSTGVFSSEPKEN